MAHPYAGHKEHHVGKRRAHKMMHGREHNGGPRATEGEGRDSAHKGFLHSEHVERKAHGGKAHHRIAKRAHGGKVKHGDEAEDRKLIRQELKKHHLTRAHGGRVKKHDGGTHIVIAMPHNPPPPVAASPAGGAAIAPPALPPGAPPPGMPMRKRGGKVNSKYIEGEPNKKNVKKWAGYASKNSYARGGHVFPKYSYGASTGMGRLEESNQQKKERLRGGK